MNAIISYNTIVGLLANPPTIDPRPNFFNLRALRNHFARALKKVPCPQSGVNGWAGAVLAPAMYALIDNNPFHWNISTTPVPEFPPRHIVLDDGTQGALIPYTREEILTITAKHTRAKHYMDTGVNVCRACFDILDAHISDAYKTAPSGSPNTVGWNSTMLPNEIFDQLMLTYGKPTPDAVRQNNVMFFSAYNPQDPPELLFKRIADCQEVAIVAKVPYTTEQLLMNVVDLFTRAGIYARDMDDWERKPPAEQTYYNLRPFIQAAYQRRLASGLITATGSGYASNNRFAGFTADDEASEDGTADTIVESINSHIANLTASVMTQSNAANDANTAMFNASMQQMAANEAQRNNDHARMIQQFAMMTTNQPGQQQFATQNRLRVTAGGGALAIPVLAPTQQYAPATQQWAQGQQWVPPGGRGRGGRSNAGRGRRNQRGPAQGAPLPFVGGNHMIPYIPAGIQQQPPPNPRYSNVVKQWANQNVCFSCGFDVEDWHTSATCNRKKAGHQDGFTRSNYLEYERANHQFCRKAMHKTMYPNM